MDQRRRTARRTVGKEFALPLLVAILAANLPMPLAAQDAEPEVEAAVEAPEAEPVASADVSPSNCPFTFFSEGDDIIDFRSGGSGTCFDMLAGSDTLVVARESFPEGIEAFTGRGADRIWASDGPDRVVDLGGEDADIRTYGGDDTIEILLPIDEDPFRGFESTSRSEIRPGSGYNQILISQDLPSNAYARFSPQSWFWFEGESRNLVRADCGRPQDAETFDLRVVEAPETADLRVEVTGCGAGFFGQHGNLSIEQLGGRFALSTEGEKFRRKLAEHDPVITGNVVASTGAFIELSKSSPESDLRWEGPGIAVFRSAFEEASGGTFRIESGADVVAEVDLSPARVDYLFAAEGGVTLKLLSRFAQTNETIRLAGSRMDVSWSYLGGGAFPSINNTLVQEVDAIRVTPPVIEYYKGSLEQKAKAMFDVMRQGGMTDATNTDINPRVPEIGPLEPESLPFRITPGGTRLTIVARDPGTGTGACLAAEVIDSDGDLPPLSAICADGAGRNVALEIEKAAEYERIRLSGPGTPEGQPIEIEINGDSGFAVNRLRLLL